MKLTANIKLNPNTKQFDILKQTLERANEACNWISKQAWEKQAFGQFQLHKLAYYTVKEKFGLSSQMTVRCIGKVWDAYKLDKKTIRKFKKHSAQPYDDRIFRMMKDDMISIWTLEGRQKIPFATGDYQRKLLETRKGEVDLMLIKGVFYLACVCDIDEDTIIDPHDILGIDLGIINLAVDSEGQHFSGKKVEHYRKIMHNRRKNIQKKGTKSAKRKLKKISGKHARYQKDVNHCISKAIVAKAKRLCSAIALEDLKGIRRRIKARKSGRARLSNWGFHQLRSFIAYKARLAGIPIFLVDPKHTSQACPECGHTERKNRPTRDTFVCKSCFFSLPADHIAALNIKAKALVNVPMVVECCVA